MENKNLRLRMITSEKKITEAFNNSSGLKINKTLKQQLQTPHYMTPIKKGTYTKTGTNKIKPKINQAVTKHISSSPQLMRSATPIPKKTRDTINCNLKKNNSYIPKILKENNHNNNKGRSLTPIRFPTQTTYGRNSSAKGSNLLKDSTDTSIFNNFQGKKNELQIILSLKRKIKRQNELLEKKEKEIENLTNDKNNTRLNELIIENGVFQKELQKMKDLIKQKDQADFNGTPQNNIYNNETSTIEEKVKDDIKTLQINMNDITEKYHNEVEKNKKLEQNYVNLNQDYTRLKNDLEKKLKEIEELKKSNNENKESELECISLDEEKLKAVNEENKELAIKIEKLNDVINHLNEIHQEAVRENASLKEEQIKIKNYYGVSLMSMIEIESISLIFPILFNKLQIEKTRIEAAFNDNQEIKEISNEICNILSINKQEVNYIERYLLNLFQQSNNDLNRVKESFIEIITKELNVSGTISENITINIKQLIQKCESFDLLSTKTISVCSFKQIFDFVYPGLTSNDFSELLNYSVTHNNNGNYSLSYIPYEHFYLLDSSLENGNRDEEIVPRNDTNLIISDVVEHKLVIEEREVNKEDNVIGGGKKENIISIEQGEIDKKDNNLLEGKKEKKDNTNGDVNEESKESLENETKLNNNTEEFNLLKEEEKKDNLASKEENKEQQKEIKEETHENDNKEKIVIGLNEEEGEEKKNEVIIKTEKKEENNEKIKKDEGNNNEKKENESNEEVVNIEKQNEKDLINEEKKNNEILQEENKENNKKEIKENLIIKEIKEENINQEEKGDENKVEIQKEEPMIKDKVNQVEKEGNLIEKEAKVPVTFEEMINLIKLHLEKNNQTINDFMSIISENDYCLIDTEKYIPIEIFISNFGILEIFNSKIISNESFEPSILNEKKDKINYKLFTSLFSNQKDNNEITHECKSKVEGANNKKEKEENQQKEELHQITKEYVTDLFNDVIDIIKKNSNSCNEPQQKIEENEEESKNIV